MVQITRIITVVCVCILIFSVFNNSYVASNNFFLDASLICSSAAVDLITGICFFVCFFLDCMKCLRRVRIS